MAVGAQTGWYAGKFVFTSLVAFFVLSNGGIASTSTTQVTGTSSYLSIRYTTSDVSASDFQSTEFLQTQNIPGVETSVVTLSILGSDSARSILSSPSSLVENSYTIITSFSVNYTVIITSTLENTPSLINETRVSSYLSSTSSPDTPGTAGLDSSIDTDLSRTMDQLDTSVVSTEFGSELSSAIISPSTTYLAIESSTYTETPSMTDSVLSSSRIDTSVVSTEFGSELSSAIISPSTTYLAIASSTYTETPSMTDSVLSSFGSFRDTTSVPFALSSTSSASKMTDSSLQPSTMMSNIGSIVTEITSTLADPVTGGTTTTSTLTASWLSPELKSSSTGLFTTTLDNSPVHTSTGQLTTPDTAAFIKTSSEISQTEHVTSRFFSSSGSSSSVLISPTSSSEAGVSSATMSTTPDPVILEQLEGLRNRVQELEDTNSGLQTATIVLALVVVFIILVIIGLVYLRRRRRTKRKKNRFAGIDADLTTPVIQRPKPDFAGDTDMAFGGRVSTATLDGNEEMSTLGTFSTLPKTREVHNNNMDTPS